MDLSHAVFASSGLRPEYLIASEAAQYLYQLHPELHGKPGHTVAALTTDLLMQGWGDAVTDNPETVREEIRQLFDDITGRILDVPEARDFYDELPEADQMTMAQEMVSAGVDLAELGSLKTGGYLKYCSRSVIANFFGKHPAPGLAAEYGLTPGPVKQSWGRSSPRSFRTNSASSTSAAFKTAPHTYATSAPNSSWSSVPALLSSSSPANCHERRTTLCQRSPYRRQQLAGLRANDRASSHHARLRGSSTDRFLWRWRSRRDRVLERATVAVSS